MTEIDTTTINTIPVGPGYSQHFDNWVERELDIYREVNDISEDDKYTNGCLESALKAYRTLLGDDHSGSSIQYTRYILNRLIKKQPLSPIYDVEDQWLLAYTKTINKEDDVVVRTYQNVRYSALFKTVYPDGNVGYSDIERFICIDVDDDDGVKFYGPASKVMDYIEPLELPYIPGEPRLIHVKDAGEDVRIMYYENKDGNTIYLDETYRRDHTTDRWFCLD